MELQKTEKKPLEITGSTFKIIACITIFNDHVGAVIIERYLLTMKGQEDIVMQILDMVLRLIGRLGFPMFCFLLIEGFFYSRNRFRYAMRLLAFCIISEIPFNLAISGQLWSQNYQNVFFTLYIGFILMILLNALEQRVENKWIRMIGNIGIIAVGAVAAEYLHTDYGACGVLTIIAMYLMRRNKMHRMLAGCIVLTVCMPIEFTSFFALIPVKLYNGKRGLSLKYVFYLFYPLHLLLLYGISILIGLA